MTTTETLVDTLSFSEEQLMIRDLVRDFAANEIAPIAIAIDREERFPRELFGKMGELGILGIPFPEAWGGGGGDWVSYCLAIEETAKVCGSTALGLAAAVSLGIGPIVNFGNDEQRRKYLPDLMNGRKLAAFGLTEPGAGSDAGGSMVTTAKRDGAEWVINGAKAFITNGNAAEVFVVTARTDASKGNRGISCFIVERGMKGFSTQSMKDKLGMRGSDTAELIFEDVRVPAENLVGEEGLGFSKFLATLDGGRIVIGTLALGLAEGALARAVRYSKERKQFGKPIAELQAIQHKLADMATRTHAARLACFHAARLKDAGRPFKQEAAMAKLFASEASYYVTKEAIQIHGGTGYCREYEVERMFRDAKLCEIGEGTSEIQKLVISRCVLGGQQ
ncbi:MAG TPA: acyl-CoA dehydrogenase family protein [Planctomycetota bacterium]|nr:acyl-CoA dehydrogenase family protein [Planctomycetota bacterium]